MTDEEKESQLKEVQEQLKKDETRRKILYAENELELLKKDGRTTALRLIIELSRKYNITAKDISTIFEIADWLGE